MKPHAISNVGNSGAGKTTLPERLIPALKGKGFRVEGIKHDAHRLNDPGAIAEFIASPASGIDRN